MQVGEWFCLTDRFNFSVDPVSDRKWYFGRQELHQRLLREVKRQYSLGLPIKLVLYGEFGVGKTHTLRHLEYYLQTNQPDFPSAPYYLECGDVDKKTRYVALHQNILDRIGIDKVKELLIAFQARHGSGWRDEIRKHVGSTDLSNAFASLLGFGPAVSMAWVWLQGQELNSSDRNSLGVSLSLDETTNLVAALRFIGKLFWEVEKKRLIVLVDEMERLQSVDDSDAVGNWTHALRLLADRQNDSVGMVLATAFRKRDDMPNMFTDAQVTRRFDEGAGYIEITTFQQKADVEVFLKDLLGYLVDKKKVQELAKKEGLGKYPKFSETTYPFTSDAFGKFLEHVVESRESPTPSMLISDLDRVGFEAMDSGQKLIDTALLQKLGWV